MGILKEPAAFVAELKLQKGFSVCELGDQQMAGGKRGLPAEAFYRELGCGRYVSIDGNGRGTVTADLNFPITLLNLGAFDLVTDFGTGEHIFDQAQVWRTIHELTRPGGFIAFDRPMQGYSKHCFYLATRGLFEDVATVNSYRIVRLQQQHTPRGQLIRGVFQRVVGSAFRIPQQGKYRSSLQLPVEGVA